MAQRSEQLLAATRRVETLTYILVLLGALALLLVPGAPQQIVLAFGLLLLPSRFLTGQAQRSPLYKTAWRLSTLLFIALTLTDYYSTGRPLRQILVVQICFFQIYKAYNDKTYSDYLLMVLFAVLTVVFSAMVTTSVLLLFILLPFVAVLTVFFLHLNLYRHMLPTVSRRRPRGDEAARWRRPSAPIVVIAAQEGVPRRLPWLLQTVSIFALGATIFYLLPRERMFSPTRFAGIGTGVTRDPALSGLSTGIDFRQFVEIKRDPRPVVKVVFPAKMPPSELIYLRAGTLERVVENQWCSVQPRPRVSRPDADGVYWFQRIAPDKSRLLIPHIVEFLDVPGDVPLALPGLVAIDQVQTWLPNYHIAVVGRLTSLRRYRAFSWGTDAAPPAGASAEDEVVWLESLRLPPEMMTRRLRQLAVEITEGCNDDLSRARAIERYLRRGYAYTLRVERLDGRDPIERFLFDYRKGNCELFAAAMVVLCRNLGIPCRIAIGYHGGVKGESPNEIIFRHMDAHAWVEVWLAGRGWTTFDPTPPAPLEVYRGRFSFKKLMEWFNSISERWDKLVVSYDSEIKARWMTYLWEPVDRWVLGFDFDESASWRLASRLRENISRPQVAALLLVLAAVNAVASVVYLYGRRKWSAKRRREATARRSNPWCKFYRAAVVALGGRTTDRQPSQTPAEFLRSLAEERRIDPAAFERMVDLYHRGRFGGMAWDDNVARESAHLLRNLRNRAAGERPRPAPPR